jgi:ribonuclease HI
MQNQKWHVFSDGASRGNPGLSGCGVFVQAPDQKEYSFKKFLGEITNNQAEYAGLQLGVEELIKLGAKHVVFHADSELMIKQMRGEYRVKDKNLAIVFAKIKGELKHFDSVEFKHVRREFNKDADELANQAIDLRDL